MNSSDTRTPDVMLDDIVVLYAKVFADHEEHDRVLVDDLVKLRDGINELRQTNRERERTGVQGGTEVGEAGEDMREARISENTPLPVTHDRAHDMPDVLLPRGYTVRESWRVVDTDNFGGDYPDERFVAEGFGSEMEADVYADAVNGKMEQHATRFLKVVKHVEIVYSLQPGFETI